MSLEQLLALQRLLAFQTTADDVNDMQFTTLLSALPLTTLLSVQIAEW